MPTRCSHHEDLGGRLEQREAGSAASSDGDSGDSTATKLFGDDGKGDKRKQKKHDKLKGEVEQAKKKQAKFAKRMAEHAQKQAQQNMLGARKLQQAKEVLNLAMAGPSKARRIAARGLCKLRRGARRPVLDRTHVG